MDLTHQVQVQPLQLQLPPLLLAHATSSPSDMKPILSCNTGTTSTQLVPSNLVVAYFRLSSSQVSYNGLTGELRLHLPQHRFKRDCCLLLTECFRRLRAYSWPCLQAFHTLTSMPLVNQEDLETMAETLIFCDGSFSRWSHYTIEGAGAVIMSQQALGANWKAHPDTQCFGYTLPPLDIKIDGQDSGKYSIRGCSS
eukprot:gb/GECG01011364.1/.p1 GENE.gb/GECG01011364.1/~~gb/GECG01011364.1/.p1  ORF type:complete len:196 (+),score=5.57 gb/GECG01011364.1/:1-588(+)